MLDVDDLYKLAGGPVGKVRIMGSDLVGWLTAEDKGSKLGN